MKYEVRDVVRNYGIYCDGKLMEGMILNNKANAERIKN